MTAGQATTPAVSVVIPTHNRGQRLAALIAALEAQRVEFPFEVVVVDDASNDGTRAALTDIAAQARIPVRALHLPQNVGPAAARNHGWRAAAAPLVAFTDDDCRPAPDWLRSLVEALGRADVVQGCTVPEPDELAGIGTFGRSVEETSEGLYPTANVGFRREVLERLGGFNELFRHPGGEDTDLAWRARKSGATTCFADEALVFHTVHAYGFVEHLREKFRWDGIPLVVREHPELRSYLHSPLFWRASHPPALAAGVGLALLAAGLARRQPMLIAAGVALQMPYIRFRTRALPVPGRTRRVYRIPAVLIGDLLEIGVLVTASVRYRSLVL
jgi:glycosyltransferase involved in cell wall biosynthesis